MEEQVRVKTPEMTLSQGHSYDFVCKIKQITGCFFLLSSF
jgi:hypothetical protein